MSVAGSTSSRGTHSRSRSRSRSPPYNDGRYIPPRYPSRYDAYSYRPRSAMSSALDDYRELRDRDRDRDRDRGRDRLPLTMRDDRYLARGRERDNRYPPRYYRDDLPPPHHYPPSSSIMSSREYPKPSSGSSVRREASSERMKESKSTVPPNFTKDVKDDMRLGSNGPDSYTPPPPRYNDWHRDRDRERERDRRYRDDWREMDMRSRDRDSYMMRYDAPAYGAPPPPMPPSLSMSYPPPFGGDSYRPDRDRDRDMPPSPGGPHLPYYDRDRMDERDFYRHVPRNQMPLDSDRYRGRSARSWGPSSSNPAPSVIGPIKGRERDRDREGSIKSPRSATSSSGIPPWAPPRGGSRDDTKAPEFRAEDASERSSGFAGDMTKQPREPDADPADRRSPPSSNTSEATAEPLKSDPSDADAAKAVVAAADDIPRDNDNPHIEGSKEEPLPEAPPSAAPTEPPPPAPAPAPAPAAIATSGKDEEREMKPDDVQPPPSVSPPVPDENSKPSIDEPEKTQPSPPPPSVTTTEAVAAAEEPRTEEAPPPKSIVEKQMTQQEIVERIDQIENDITMYEELLEELNKQEESKKESNDERETASTATGDYGTLSAEEQKEREEEEAAKQQALQVISESAQPMADIENLSSLKASPVMRKRPQLLINQARYNDETDDLLSEKLIAENRKIAKENSKMIGGWQGHPDTAADWSDEEEWTKPLHQSIEDYPCYKENVKNFDKVKVSIANSIAQQNKALKRKELRLKKEYRELYEEWKQRNLTLDRIRDHERRASEKFTYRSQSRRRTDEDSEEYVDGVIFNGDSDALRFGTDGNAYTNPAKGAWTSDAARSEAELLEIIQSLESADMRNPELRAAKTTATIPAMILDEKERMRTFDDRRGLVTDPLTYYHTGPETEDHWTQQEMTAFMESYMQYPKQFEKIAAAVKTKTAPQCVLFYYRKKTKIDFKVLVSKGRRGKAAKRRDRLAAAVRRAAGGSSSSTRKAKSKGSALMTDIGEAQVSRKAKQKESERKSRELRELEEANAYWDGVNERRRTKKPGSTPAGSTSGPQAPGSTTSTFGPEEVDKARGDKRRLPRRKGRSPRGSAGVNQAAPGEGNNEESTDEMDTNERNLAQTAKWTDKDKEAAIEAFKAHGRNFTRVATLVGTKTEDQCRNFYHNFKRKYGPNAFDEEAEAATTTPAVTTNEIASARPDLKAEEEDAAAALMGMCRMGAATPPGTSTSTKPAHGHTRTLSTQMDDQRQARGSISSTASAGTRRRRARTSSGKAIDSDIVEEWMDTEFTANRPVRRPGRPPGTTMSSDLVKRPAYSSYWSVAERSDFKLYLEKYGCDWEKVANALTSKTATQVRNYYVNNEEKMQLDQIAKLHDEAQQQPQQQQQPQPQQPQQQAQEQPASISTYDESSKAHFQVLQNLPLPQPVVTEQTTGGYTAPGMGGGPRVGYFTPSPPAPPPRQHQGVIHAYGPPPGYGALPPPPTQASAAAYPHHHSHPHPSHPHPYPPMHSDRPAHPLQPPSPRPPPPAPASEPSSSVTKVADLLNSDEPADSTNQNNWESWFS
ncbi:hypothetical protein BJV82DRAFT_708241 [Fennellomyces sp. T-0311]|nr:hypothetical protein BJV82DRAFT_708241 [Fennellomyces sp. T-0311]